VAYRIPPNYPEDKREQLVATLDKGQELYKINCSECHGIFTQAKDHVPDFTITQIDNYNLMFMRRDPRNHAVSKKMSPDQMNAVVTFLKYKKTDTTGSKKKKA